MATSTPAESRSRWVTPASYVVPGALGATILTVYMPNTGLNVTEPMSNGTWTVQPNTDNQGSIGTIIITIEGGRITATSYEATLTGGTGKGAEHGKNSAGEVFNEDYYKKAQAAVAPYQEYSDNLIKISSPTKVDVITGATATHQQFVRAVIRATTVTQGVSPDGTDDINIPGLNNAIRDGDLDKDLRSSDG